MGRLPIPYGHPTDSCKITSRVSGDYFLAVYHIRCFQVRHPLVSATSYVVNNPSYTREKLEYEDIKMTGQRWCQSCTRTKCYFQDLPSGTSVTFSPYSSKLIIDTNYFKDSVQYQPRPFMLYKCSSTRSLIWASQNAKRSTEKYCTRLFYRWRPLKIWGSLIFPRSQG